MLFINVLYKHFPNKGGVRVQKGCTGEHENKPSALEGEDRNKHYCELPPDNRFL